MRSASHDGGRDDDRHRDHDRPEDDAERRVLVVLHLLLQREGEELRQDREEDAEENHAEDREHDRRRHLMPVQLPPVHHLPPLQKCHVRYPPALRAPGGSVLRFVFPAISHPENAAREYARRSVPPKTWKMRLIGPPSFVVRVVRFPSRAGGREVALGPTPALESELREHEERRNEEQE